ncbi:1-(5-phosphoribosyl)-5-[(5-phosphoribosylamino)methylideneamino]imidazole-4-carboxamide isomerase [Robiginitalea sediminis]|uniref:1-(5-phosphoribosyl)-5-[(5- phosphoribosylamino)methylideneamino]imidazole-4- carboxamide isomerase n=1 Tax=Robiginitalea sediminis TaxID=1982593 RepID=UPI000B4AAE05|nr:1-(5-phosphoribosyl)-5-[(5-phosphoribosylamino)methylideneamino]imidazole-4-carboxamide isomerase [Robiginitalea sediminis]
MRIIPAIDIIGGKCVRLTKGDYATQKTYSEDPLEMAKAFEDHGVAYLHLVDLDGARQAHVVNHRVLERIAAHTSLKIDFGGGLKSEDDLRIAFECGAAQVTGGSIAVKDPETFLGWVNRHGGERIILGADAHNGKIAVSGWQESSSLALEPFVMGYLDKGLSYVVCTDISKDGMLEGPAAGLYRDLLAAASGKDLRLIASGGIRSTEDLRELAAIGCEGAIVGKAIYEGRIPLKELLNWNNE